MKTQNPERVKQFDSLIEYLYNNLNSETFVNIDADAVAEQIVLPIHVVRKGIMLLEHEIGAIETSKRGMYKTKPALFDSTGEMLDKALLEYQREHLGVRKKEGAAQDEEGEQLEIEPVLSVTESTFAAQQYTANITSGSALTLAELLNPIRKQFGFELQGQTVWFTTKTEAAKEAQLMAIKHDIEQVELIQKVGVVVNRPTVTYFQ